MKVYISDYINNNLFTENFQTTQKGTRKKEKKSELPSP